MKPSILSIFIAGLLIASCSGNNPEPKTVPVNISFSHLVDGQTVQLDQLIYKNVLDQEFSIKTVKYFVSSITLHKKDGSDISFDDVHYVDIRTPETLSLELSKMIEPGEYTGISFVHGLDKDDNINGRFTEAPESLMEWPMMMGGGYHYMKLEGEYKTGTTESFFNFHSGGLDGTEYEVAISLDKSFTVGADQLSLEFEMEIQNWFTNPVDWDFTYFGSGIMGNHEAQQTVQKNGVDVYAFEVTPTL